MMSWLERKTDKFTSPEVQKRNNQDHGYASSPSCSGINQIFLGTTDVSNKEQVVVGLMLGSKVMRSLWVCTRWTLLKQLF